MEDIQNLLPKYTKDGSAAAPYKREFYRPNPSWVPKIKSFIPFPLGEYVAKYALIPGKRYIFVDYRYLVYGFHKWEFNGVIFAEFVSYEENENFENVTDSMKEYYKINYRRFIIKNIKFVQEENADISLERFSFVENGCYMYPNGHELEIYEFPEEINEEELIIKTKSAPIRITPWLNKNMNKL